MELHIWGSERKDPVSFTPECMAAVWLVELLEVKGVRVIASSNPNISPSGVLPALRDSDSGQVYGGFMSIWRYLKSIGYNLDSDCGQSPAQCAESTALLAYLDSTLGIVSSYLLYLHKNNYENYTRPLFTKLVPFPMQYSMPWTQYELASRRCSDLAPSSTKAGQKELEIDSPLVRKMQEEQKEKKSNLESAKENIKLLNYASQVLDKLQSKLTPNLVGSNLCTADVLLLAHLHLYMGPQLPDRSIKSVVEQFPKLVEYYGQGVKKVNAVDAKIEQATGRDVPSLVNAILNW